MPPTVVIEASLKNAQVVLHPTLVSKLRREVSLLSMAFEGMLRRIQSDPANAAREGDWFLNEAFRLVQEQRASNRLEAVALQEAVALWDEWWAGAPKRPGLRKDLTDDEIEKFRQAYWSELLAPIFPPDKRDGFRVQFDAATAKRMKIS